ncbi:hypothetical protein B5M42_004160 [Paenibacillus athensensis]|uniref:Lipoprotein n=1 Tax=Paenibacillus athensensis TaxID=1967502 RepID=A0A4Y8PZQ0_9BACL|nr:hypothetical protein [Paenibacillus athensensis]MCD1258031.1 hypothetical protein [Paenibacillus athensensis]
MKLIRSLLLLLSIFTIPALTGCAAIQPLSASAEDDSAPYVPADYAARLSAMHLSEVTSMPAAAPPFIAIAEDPANVQYAVVFDKNGDIRQVRLPLGYADILARFRQQAGPAHTSSADEDAVRLVASGQTLVWQYSDGRSRLAMSLDGVPAQAAP